MGKYFSVGNAGFQSIIKSQYVDKTGLIAYINSTLGTKDKLTCFSRPRRFGKSYSAQMLCAYYDQSCDSSALFKNCSIAADPSFYQHLNCYPVIYLDITWFIANDRQICDKDVVDMIQQEVITELHLAYPDVPVQDTLPKMLLEISELTGDRFIVIIDEWDALFRERKEADTLQKKYIQLLRGLFKTSGQTDKMIEAAYMTGILPIKKYGTQSALTDFHEYTMLKPEPLEAYVGFTEEEVQELCRGSRLSFSDIQKWYDGYVLGDDVHLYSPKSVMDALKKQKLGNYWTQSETYESLKAYIEMDEDGLQDAVTRMLGGERIEVDAETFQNDLVSIHSRDDVLTLLVHLGYLAYDYHSESVYIPNIELQKEFIRTVKKSTHPELLKMMKAALEQIRDRSYPEKLEGLAEEILLVGITYDKDSKKHWCEIERYEKGR